MAPSLLSAYLIYLWLQVCYLIACGDDMEDAGPTGPLFADHIVRPAEDSPELHVWAGGVGQPGLPWGGIHKHSFLTI
jgi:hypothetical protein